jgi:ribosomal protein S6--L-glutamate ligase
MHIAIFLQKLAPDTGPRINPVTGKLIERLRQKGAKVDLLVAEDDLIDIGQVRSAHDLYVLKSKSPLTLSVAAILESDAAAVVNSVEACVLVRDKIAATAVLAGAGVPVPPSWTTADPTLMEALVHDGPAWLKPQGGSKGRGVRRVAEVADLALNGIALNSLGQPVPLFIQREVPRGMTDLKVYVVGESAWAVSKPWPTRTEAEKTGIPAVLPDSIREVALRCGQALGLEIYGVDVLVDGDQFWVVDVNAFPGSRGVAELPSQLADYLYARALGTIEPSTPRATRLQEVA